MFCKQVKFMDADGVMRGGILIEGEKDKGVICGCCGGFYELDDEDMTIVEEYNFWNDISNEITGD